MFQWVYVSSGHGLQTCFYPGSVGIDCTVRFFVWVAILLLHLCRATSKNDKNETRPHRWFAFYTRAARLKGPLNHLFALLYRNGKSESSLYWAQS